MRVLVAAPLILLVTGRAYLRKSLTVVGCIAAASTATIHALHPSALPFSLLLGFFVIGTAATKAKHDVKKTLTLSSSGSSGGEGPRTSIQVLANSGCASILCLVHVWLYGVNNSRAPNGTGWCFAGPGAKTPDLILLGIMANYAAVAADTLSSELGILSRSAPVLITSLKTVPRGTNGGVTLAGLGAGVGGAVVIGLASVPFLSLCTNARLESSGVVVLLALMGTAGTLLDSLLGAVLQASVVDRRTGKVIEAPGGVKVLTRPKEGSTGPAHARKVSGEESRSIGSGNDILDNNQINFLMASTMTITGIVLGGLIFR
jgi:uncharacterized membrane protein